MMRFNTWYYVSIHVFLSQAIILLPLRPTSLMYQNPPKRTKVHGMRSVKRSINRSEDVLVEYPARVILVAVLVAVV